VAAGHIGCMKLPSRPGAWSIHLHPGFLVIAVAMWAACGFLLGAIRFKATGAFEVQWWEAILAGSLALSAVAAHEGAHALVGAWTGRRIERIEFGLKIGVVSAGDSTALRRAASIAVGPVAEIVVGALLWGAAGGGASALLNPVGLAGVMAVFNGAANLVPFHPSAHGFKMFRFLILAARGHRILACRPSGQPCPACSGAVAEVAGNKKTPASVIRVGGICYP
jgi:hypothetical protein